MKRFILICGIIHRTLSESVMIPAIIGVFDAFVKQNVCLASTVDIR